MMSCRYKLCNFFSFLKNLSSYICATVMQHAVMLYIDNTEKFLLSFSVALCNNNEED